LQKKSEMKFFLIGFMGSGKTHWGELLAHELNLPFFDLDKVITEKVQKPGQRSLRKMEKNTSGLKKKNCLKNS
jgi:shikimate kinase